MPFPFTQKDLHSRTWGNFLLERLLYPITVFGTPSVILLLLIYFIVRNFQQDAAFGLRSLSGALLPLIASSFVFAHARGFFPSLARFNPYISCLGALVWGIIVMVIIRVFGVLYPGVPLSELSLAATFSVLVFGNIHPQNPKIASYYYGVVLGFLVYIIVAGFPIPFATP